MGKLHSINEAQRLYVLESGAGFSCIGFDVLESWLAGYLSHLERHGKALAFDPAPMGTPERHAQYKLALAGVQSLYVESGRRIRCESQLSPQLRGYEGRRVEVIDSPGEKPRRFIVGKSTGFVPIHLEIARRNSSGGGAAMSPYYSVRAV